MNKFSFLVLSMFLVLLSTDVYSENKSFKNKAVPESLPQVRVGGELQVRILKNFDRLEEKKYQPAHVFLTDEQSGHWQGDTE